MCVYYIQCYDVDAGTFDGSRLFSSYNYGPVCGEPGCPSCDCGDHGEGDRWYIQYQDSYDYKDGSITCALCECIGDSDGNYASCDYITNYPIGTGSCPPTNKGAISCFESEYPEGGDWGWDGGYYNWGGGWDSDFWDGWSDNYGGGWDWGDMTEYMTTDYPMDEMTTTAMETTTTTYVDPNAYEGLFI